MRVRHIKNIEEKIKEYDRLFYKDDQKFKNDNPIQLEIGMGKGRFIYEHALKYPNINFIGLEKCSSIIYKALKEIKPLDNLKFLNIDAINLDFFDHQISKIFLNFSDPWSKSRHEKRRLTSSNYLNLYQKILTPDGVIELKTDNESLFEYSLVKFSEHQFKLENVSVDLHRTNDKEIIKTEYEMKFIEKGLKIYYLKVKL